MEQLQKLLPENFRELFSFFAFFVSLIFAFISLIKVQLEHGLRMAAMLFVVALSLFANNGYCYFGAIFIIATAVTQLDFLQNLAAIIRGSKEYFDYKKDTKPLKQVQHDIEKESKIIEGTVEDSSRKLDSTTLPQVNEILKNKNGTSTDNMKTPSDDVAIEKPKLTAGSFGLLVQEKVFRYLENRFQKPIERYVRIHLKDRFFEFDGIMPNGDIDIIFEIKITRMGSFPNSFLFDQIDTLTYRLIRYKEVTKRYAALRIFLVGNFTDAYKAKIISGMAESIMENRSVEVAVEFLSFSEIELSPEMLNG